MEMQKYIGTKIINAKSMTRADYNTFRGWLLPENENGNDAGYLVEYIDSKNSNTAEYKGYVSWSPKLEFDNAYQLTKGMNFGLAIEAMKKGFRVARAGWNGKGMWCIYVPGSKAELRAGTPYYNAISNNGQLAVSNEPIEILPHFDMWTVNAEGRRAFLPGWLASQSDMDAVDWSIVE